jgi:hypothetical protein
MLSGDEIFAREDHRGRPLISILRKQRFEHVHPHLVGLMIENPAGRMRFADLTDRIKEMEALVMGDFAPPQALDRNHMQILRCR